MLDVEEAKRRARLGPRVLLARRAIMLGITFISTVTVARLVSPREYGLANMSVVLMAFAQIFRDFGVTNAVMRKGHVSQAELSMIFWFNVATTTTLSTLIILVAPAISNFYREPVITWTIIVSVVGFQVSGVALQHRALINRELRFSTIAQIEVVAAFVGFLVTLILAFLRHDVWAIVIGNLTQSVVSGALAVMFSGWRPSRPTRTAELGSLLRFGANSSVFSISVFLSNNAAAILIGHFLGSSPLGQYNRAQVVFQLPLTNLVQPIAQATLPLLRRLRPHPEEYREAYLGLVRRLCVFLMPLSVALMIAAVPLTKALLGDRWHDAGLVLTALAPALSGMALAYAASDILVTQNRSSELRNLGIVELLIRVGSVVGGLMYGLIPAAIGFSASSLVVAILRSVVAGRSGPVTIRDQFLAVAPGLAPMLGGALGGAAAFFVSSELENTRFAVIILISSVLGALLVGVAFKPSRSAISEVCELMLGRKFVRLVGLTSAAR